MEWNKQNKINSSVVTSGFIGAIAAPGAVFCAERVLPHQMSWLKRVVADTVVLPHLERFESLSAKMRHANEKRCAEHPETCKPDPALQGEDPASPRGRALAISDGLVTSLLAWQVDFAATLGSQHFINRQFGINTSPLKTAFVDSAVSLGAMGVMATWAAKPTEAMMDTLSSAIQKLTGMSKNHADDLAVPGICAGIPNIIGTLAAIKTAHGFGGGR